jgi:hypothetical protein
VALIGSGNLPPVANAGGPYEGAVGEEITFNGSGSIDLDGNIVAYEWDFGDDTTGSGKTPTHTYTAADVYYVTLTVTDDTGAVDSSGTNVLILSPLCECDLNTDGSCDMSDFLLFSPDWERTDCNEADVEPCECDLNDDGSCNVSDLLLFLLDWGRDDCPVPVD